MQWLTPELLLLAILGGTVGGALLAVRRRDRLTRERTDAGVCVRCGKATAVRDVLAPDLYVGGPWRLSSECECTTAITRQVGVAGIAGAALLIVTVLLMLAVAT
jgi:hypothetical protein